MSDRPLDVALLAPTYWPEVRRGTERFTHELASRLAARGHRAGLITSYPGRRVERSREDGFDVLRLPRPPDGQLTRRMFESHLTHVPLSYAALRLRAPGIAHALYPTDALAAARWSRKTGRPSILSYMGIPERWWLSAKRMRRKVTAQASHECDAVVALSRAAADEFERVLGIAPRVIAPGVDTAYFTPGGERSERPSVFCAASVAEPSKRVQVLIHAFELVRRQRPDATLVLSRPADPAAARAVSGEGVELVDVDDRDRLRDAYRSAWVTALPSVGEAFGLVLVESMACGTAAVGRHQGAIPEVLNSDSVGRLFEGGEEELARALMEALELAGDASTAEACRSRAAEFSSERCANAYEALYRELLSA